MIPQGSIPLNLTYFSNLASGINSAASCAELQTYVTEAFASIAGVKDGITAELASIDPVLALLSPPGSNLGEIVTWLTTFITAFLTPMLKPAVTYATQLTELAAQIATLSAAISSAQAKFPSCSITVPSI